MKHFLILLFLVCSANAFTQSPYAWSVRHSGVADQLDEPTVILIDGQENIYVGGFGVNQGNSHQDGLLFKYDLNGNQLWMVHDTLVASILSAVLDQDGNLYVLAPNNSVAGLGTSLIKYDTSGAEVWRIPDLIQSVNATNGKLMLDPSGDLVVVMQKFDLLNSNAIVILKKDINGNDVWTEVYPPPANAELTDAILDNSGNIYFTGSSGVVVDPVTFQQSEGDVMVVKYDTGGNQLWATHEGAQYHRKGLDIELDPQDNIYVEVAQDSLSYNYAVTMKFNSDGTLNWEDVSPISSLRLPTYSQSLVVDPNNQLYSIFNEDVTSTPGATFFVRSFAYNGTSVWQGNPTGPNGFIARFMRAGPGGFVTVAGFTTVNGFPDQNFIHAFDPFGLTYFTQVFQGPGSVYEVPIDLVYGPTGDVYMILSSFTSGGKDIVTAKLANPATQVPSPDQSSELSVQIFPHPLTSRSEMVFSSSFLNGSVVEFYDGMGLMVMHKPVQGNSLALEKADFGSGMFFYRVMGKDGRLGSGRLVVE